MTKDDMAKAFADEMGASQKAINSAVISAVKDSKDDMEKGVFDEIMHSREAIVSSISQVVKESQGDIKSSVSLEIKNSINDNIGDPLKRIEDQTSKTIPGLIRESSRKETLAGNKQ